MPITDIECVKIFPKDELLAIARELGIAVDISIPYTKVYALITNDISENGIPEIDDNVSDLLGSFLATVGYIDEEGNVLESDESEEEEEEQPRPPCWSFYSEYDPSCQGCKVKINCGRARVANRPECFGRYEQGNDSCRQCLEMVGCSNLQKSGEKSKLR